MADGGVVLYEVQIKNWCAHSLGGRSLAIDVAAIAMHGARTWKRYWDEAERRPLEKPLRKVLVPMRVPRHLGTDRAEPVACVWDLLSPDGAPTPWFSVPASGVLERLHWFSMSSYLRSLLRQGVREIELAMPILEARLAVVERMVPAVRQAEFVVVRAALRRASAPTGRVE